jgi:Ca-activated chloride channel family protein
MMKAFLMTLMMLAASTAFAQQEDDTYSGRLQAIGDSGVVGDLPLEHTSVDIVVTGNLQRAVVHQVYGNPYTDPIEAVYTFPLPDDGAVDRMNMYIGDRLVVGRIYERDMARTIYEDAISAGQTASLLEQERPNIFTQSVGNILPGDSITIEISYVAPVVFDDGKYELSFPTVIGPRFIPGDPTGSSGTGWAPNTDQVPDASRITPHVVPEGMRTGYDIDISVTLNTGFPITSVNSLNHEIEQNTRPNGTTVIRLSRRNEIPNRDFVLDYTSSSDRIEAGVIATNGDLGGHFMLILQPDLGVDTDEITPKEMFFVVDCSGSMSGQPIEVAKETVRQFIRGMNPDDTFQIMRFSEGASSMSGAPLTNTTEHVEQGIRYIDAMEGEGGTLMIEGIRAAIGYPEDPDRMRYVVFITDGFIGNEAEIAGEIQSTLGENTRIFSIGVGSSPNRYLIETLAEEGRGASYYVGLDQDPEEQVSSIYEKINSPYLVGIDIDWGRLKVNEVYPALIPDLFAGQPLVVVGQYQTPGRGTVRLTGTVNGHPWSRNIEVTLPEHEEDNDVIATLWARRRIHELSRLQYDPSGYENYNQEIVDEITDTALDYQIMSNYTSFVAVSEEVRTVDGRPVTVEVPVNMPQGVSYDGVFGEGDAAGAIYAGFGGGAVGTTGLSRSCAQAPMVSANVAACEEYDYDGSYGHDYVYEYTPQVSMTSAAPYLGLRPSEVRQAFRDLNDSVLEAYTRFAERNKDENNMFPTGSMTFAVEFDDEGNVVNVEVVSDGLENASFARTVATLLRSAVLPGRPDASGTISVTLSFSAV